MFRRLLLFAGALALVGCSSGLDIDKDITPFDSSKPVEFTDFSPKEGALRTRLFINGSNFGTDLTKIRVTVGGQDAGVVGSTGSTIYCMVPPRAYSGEISVAMLDEKGDTVTKYTFADRFEYHAHKFVGTYLRNVDEKGESRGIIYGDVNQASIDRGDFMVFQYRKGESKDIFMSTWNGGIAKFDLLKNTFEQVMPKRHNEMRSFTFTADGDTLLMPDDNGQAEKLDQPTIYYALRSEGFKKDHVYGYGTCSYSVASRPVDHTVFYQSWTRGGVYKLNGQYNVNTREWEPKKLFELASFFTAGDGQKMNMFIHPTGDYMYIIGPTMHGLLKSVYNYATHEFTYPIVAAGDVSSTGYVEGVGDRARFSDFMQCGDFIKNEQYVEKGSKDQYDFYVADTNNDCIRRITPEGATDLIAGRANANSDGKTYGYVDGDPIKEARMRNCAGMCYDYVDDVIYWVDNDSHSIRYLKSE